MGEHVSADCKTLYVRQSVWNSKEQDPKTENAVRDIDVCSELAVMLKDYIGTKTTVFYSIPTLVNLYHNETSCVTA
jgi:hypothetical protein